MIAATEKDKRSLIATCAELQQEIDFTLNEYEKAHTNFLDFVIQARKVVRKCTTLLESISNKLK